MLQYASRSASASWYAFSGIGISSLSWSNDKAQRRESSSVLWSRMFYFFQVSQLRDNRNCFSIFTLFIIIPIRDERSQELAEVGRQAARRAVLGVFDEYSMAR